MTIVERKNWHMTAYEICPRRHRSPETIMNLLRDCDDIRD